MTADHAKLTAKITAARRSLRIVSWIVAVVAVAIMIYGIPIVYVLLTGHGVPPGLAWLLSPAVDGALAVGIIATNVLAGLGKDYGWVGAIRWFAGITTWGLNTAGPWTALGGPDWLGVVTHTAGPLILFVLVEGVAQFQHRVGEAIADMERKLADADARRAAESAERTALTERVNRLTADLAAAAQRERQYVEQVESVKAAGEAETARLTAELATVRADAESLRTALAEAAERHTAELTERLTALKAKHTEAMVRLRAELSPETVNISDYRRTHDRRATTGRAAVRSGEPGGRSVLTDEDAVRKLLAEDDNPNREWSQAEIRRVTGVGFGRTARILAAITDYHRRTATGSSGDGPVTRTGDLTDDAKEDHPDDLAALTG